MDGLGLALFLAFMLFGILSGGRKKKKPREIPPEEISVHLPRRTQHIPAKKKTWDIPGPKAEAKKEPEPEINFVFAEADEEKIQEQRFREEVGLTEKRHTVPHKQEQLNIKQVNWQQAMVLSQILSPPKSRAFVRRYSKVR